MKNIQTFQIDYLSPFFYIRGGGGGRYGLDIHSMKKIDLLDFSIQRLWGKFLKISMSVSVLNFFSK